MTLSLKKWSETEFNRRCRDSLRTVGFNVLHIREADQVGVCDLLIWTKQYIEAWVELKVFDREVEPNQITFIRSQWEQAKNAYVVRWTGIGMEFQASHDGPITVFGGEPKDCNWTTMFGRARELYLRS